MSANGDDGEDIPGREIAYRLFAKEYDDASFSYAESDEERAPNYVISPTGARLNRIFAVGTLTEVTSVNDEMVRARIVDPTGAFVVYAGQYQPDELATLEQLEAPEFVAVTGKARTFQPDDSDQVYTSVRPESIATVDADTRDRWVVSAAEQTLERIGTYAAAADVAAHGDDLSDALAAVDTDAGLAAGIPLAQDHYGTTPAYLADLRECALEAVEVVADERDQVGTHDLQPSDSSPETDATFSSLASFSSVDLEHLESLAGTDAADGTQHETAESELEADSEPDAEVAVAGESESIDSGSAAGTATATDREAASEAESDAADPVEETPIETDAETTDDSTEGDDTVTADSSDLSSESEPTDAEPASGGADAAADADDDLGDFDAGDSGMYEMDDDEREQLEEEFGTEFTTGGEVDDPGEADIDVPEPEDDGADDASSESAAESVDASTDDDDDIGEPPESGLEAEAEPEPDPADEPDLADELEEGTDAAETEEETATDAADADDSASEDEPAGEDDDAADDVDLQTAVVETMEELDDGDGADRSELVETIADETGVAEGDVEDAIQDALMGGQCYEPDDETLKAI
ncbi:hypothetical protein [Natronorubrum daqingense]|uniref:Rpa-associated protein n=1 Tax=Natronorubrum daqingense TaxID=588898 RepID=A0A1N7FJW6_9EURY|nr:hypothetical protein [Natronorubrum daqingense]APX98330.1 hypothetical protein BB347_16600 [Natronorubrum daqingense]SIS00577.1 hypothetical protein SAMN05421809_3295 [Natronorubrum daqingense]